MQKYTPTATPGIPDRSWHPAKQRDCQPLSLRPLRYRHPLQPLEQDTTFFLFGRTRRIRPENTTRIYDAIIDSPGSYLPYTVGFLQIEELRQYFPSAKNFHTYLLNMGPTSFSILKKYVTSEK